MPQPVETELRNCKFLKRKRRPLTENECNRSALPSAQIHEGIVEASHESLAMLSVMHMVVFVMVFVAMMLGWWVVWVALGGRARVNHLDIYALVGGFNKRPAKCLPESVRDLDTLLTDAVESNATAARARHL
jgi:hypothetical protein